MLQMEWIKKKILLKAVPRNLGTPVWERKNVELPEGYNWCELGAVTKVKNGCSGGLPENAYKTLIEIGGLETEEDYGEDKACKFNRSQVAAWR